MKRISEFKTAITEEFPRAVEVRDPFRALRPGGTALDECRCRVQLDTCGHRVCRTDPLYASRWILDNGADLLIGK